MSLAVVQDYSVYLKAWLGCDGWPEPQLEESVSWRDTFLLCAWVSKRLVSFLAGSGCGSEPQGRVWVPDPLPAPSPAGTRPRVRSRGLDWPGQPSWAQSIMEGWFICSFFREKS